MILSAFFCPHWKYSPDLPAKSKAFSVSQPSKNNMATSMAQNVSMR
ncbi:hypothetical protein SB444474_5559 [Shigella boydii 4444-74]|uniref:Uncharacterized protein n=1 Tax=Shigella boydii 4444-74 TaxID=766140 RepID=I6EZ61_SHIBO|nr:hypothetical protein SB444474_5559 [Shigella boydii 4444-74]